MKYYFFAINSYFRAEDKQEREGDTRGFLDGGIYADWRSIPNNIPNNSVDFLKGRKIISRGNEMLGVYVDEPERKVLESLGFTLVYSHTRYEDIKYIPSKRKIRNV
jgi:hypothetical protein